MPTEGQDPMTSDIEAEFIEGDKALNEPFIPGDIWSLLEKAARMTDSNPQDGDFRDSNICTMTTLYNDKDDNTGNDNNATDDEDAPNWEFDVNEMRSQDPAYEFCPAAHHKQLLYMVTQHFC